MPGVRAQDRTEAGRRRRAARRHTMAALASAVVAAGSFTPDHAYELATG
ncbi:hypothetical protein ACFRH6_35580 [Streptomyces sp. NPDC056749]